MQVTFDLRQSRAKYFIDYEKEVRECGDCRFKKPFSMFSKSDLGYPKSICKSCIAKRSARYRRIKK